MTFKEVLLHHYKLSQEECDITFSYFKPEFYEPKQLFLEEGNISDKIAVVSSGLFRTFFINDDADEVTTNFNEPKTLLISGESFNGRIPAKENIITVIPSEVLSITYNDMKELYTRIPIWNRICIDTAEWKNKLLADRAREFQTLTATERYKKFCKEHNIVYQNATLGQIASFLGIDIATLSRIRKKAYK